MREWLERRRIILLFSGLLSSPTITLSPTMKKTRLRIFPLASPSLSRARSELATYSHFQMITKWNDGWGGGSLAWQKPSLCTVFLFPVTRQSEDSGWRTSSTPLPAVGWGQMTYCLWTSLYSTVKWGYSPEEWGDYSVRWLQETCFIKCSPCKAVTVNLAGPLSFNSRAFLLLSLPTYTQIYLWKKGTVPKTITSWKWD